jgi:hypothetical protein
MGPRFAIAGTWDPVFLDHGSKRRLARGERLDMAADALGGPDHQAMFAA